MSQQQQQGPSQPPAGRGNFSSTVGPLQSRDYYGFYSNSGFDMLSALAKVASRKNPTINLGPVDLSSAFVVSDALLEDHPIIYVSSNFETLTGYVARDIIGKNCRFLQSPNGVVTKGERRRFVDDGVVYQIKRSLEEFQECQFVNINYKKSGEPFVNLVTIVPVSMDDTGYISHFVGFQIDIMKQSSSILRRLEGGLFFLTSG